MEALGQMPVPHPAITKTSGDVISWPGKILIWKNCYFIVPSLTLGLALPSEYPFSSKICDREAGCGSEFLLLRAILLHYIPGREQWVFFPLVSSVCLDVLFQINLSFFSNKIKLLSFKEIF